MTATKTVKRKTKSERTTEAQIELETEILKQIEDTQQDTNKCSEYDIETEDAVLYTYTRHLRKL